MSVLLKVEKISCSVKNKNILREVDFEVTAGEILGISGESGSGKTTLAKIIAGIIKPNSGKLNWNNAKSNSISSVQLLFQNNGEILNPYRKIGNVIKDALLIHNTPKNEIEKRAEELFNETGVKPELYSRRGYELSGGERQRIALARLLAVNPEVLILDEPFSAQDITSQINLVKVLERINEELNVTMICISHDLKILRKFAHRVIVLQKGRIVETGDASKIFSSPTHPYTKFLLSAEEFSLTEEAIHNFNS